MNRIWMFCLILMLAACGGGGNTGGNNGDATPAASGVEDFDIRDASLLAWVGDGVVAGQHRADAPGQLVMINARGELEPVLELPTNTIRVHACSEQATSPDGRTFTFFVGAAERGTLYQMVNADAPQVIAEVDALTCLGAGTFQYEPDNDRFGYIDFASGAASAKFPAGTLNIRNTRDRQVQQTVDNVVSFDFGESVVAIMSFFANERGEATQAAIFRWRSGTPQEVTTLFPESGCQFQGGQVATVTDNSFVALTLQGCANGQRTWQLYTVNAEDETSNQMLSGSAPNGISISSGSRIAYLNVSPNAQAAYLTYPNGNALNLTNLERVNLSAPQDDDPIVQNAVMPRFATSVNAVYNPRDNAAPVLSLDGRWLAVVSNDANNRAVLHVLDLNNLTGGPRSINAPNAGDTISALAFSRDSARLFFVMGGNNRNNNELFQLELETVLDERIIRGRYANQMVVSPDGRYVALPEWQPEYLNLVVVDVESGQAGTLFEGARIEDGRVRDQRFVYPLAWRR
ncbi:MAG: hypothetical protein OHK0046_20360 [Anaerolineae bacterium]